MQLQIALALSREEAEKATEMEKSDDVRLQLALEESKREADEMSKREMGTVNSGQLSQSAVDDLLSLGLGDLVVSFFPAIFTPFYANFRSGFRPAAAYEFWGVWQRCGHFGRPLGCSDATTSSSTVGNFHSGFYVSIR